MSLRDDDLDPSAGLSDREALSSIALLLQDGRPVPSARFRGELRRQLDALRAPGGLGVLARRRVAIGSLAAGLALLGLAAAGLADVGPLAPATPDEAIASLIASLFS